MSKKTSRCAFSYIRFSTAQQAEGGSLKRQTDLTEAYCERKGLALDDSLHLQDLGVSAFRGSNVRDGALAGFLEACRVGRVPRGSVLVVESLDRLSRDQIRPALQLFLSLQDFGITIVTLQPEREYPADATDALALIEPLIVFARDHEESLMKSHRRKNGWKQARDKARQGGGPMMKTCPGWLDMTDGGFQVKEEAAATVRHIFALCREGYGIQRITAKLTRDGVPPIGSGGRWVKAFVYRILTNPAAMGTYQPMRQDGKRVVPDGEPIPSYYPPVISEAEWREAQKAIQGRDGAFETGGRGSPAAGRKGKDDHEANLFTGLARDAKTGERMHIAHAFGRKGEGERKRYLYLTASPEGGSANGRRFDYHAFEFAILDRLKELKPCDIQNGEDQAEGTETEEKRLSDRLIDLAGRIEKTKARARKAEDFDAFLDMVEALQTEQRQVRERLEELQQERAGDSSAVLKDTHTIIDVLRKAKPEERDELRRRLKLRIRQLISEIRVLIVPKGRARLAAVQVYFAANKRQRSYLVYHEPLVRSEPLVKDFEDIHDSADLDLRRPDHAARLQRVLEILPIRKS
jgi:DNA invertase Pin-like site-specific DNA recombinase